MEITLLLEKLQQQWEEGDWLLTLGFLRDEFQHWRTETVEVLAEVVDGEEVRAAFEAVDFTAIDEESYYDALNEAMTLVEEAIQLVAVSAGQVIELHRTQPGGIEMTPILPPWDMVEGILAGVAVSDADKGRMRESLNGLWVAAGNSELEWGIVRGAAIAAAELDYNLFFMLISYLLERQNDIV
jgi:hypothetical protein